MGKRLGSPFKMILRFGAVVALARLLRDHHSETSPLTNPKRSRCVVLKRVPPGVAAAALAALLAFAGTAGAMSPEPALRLVSVTDSADVVRYGPDEPAFGQVPVWVVAPVGAPFELRVARAALGKPIGVTRIVHGPRGPAAVRLPADVAAGFIPGGIAGFLTLTVRDAAGAVVLARTTNFCPVSRSRFDPASPDAPVYPDACGGFEGGNPFTLGQVWGIEGGWGASALGFDGGTFEIPDGSYTATIAIAPRHRELFAIPADAAEASFTLRVRTEVLEEPPPGPGPTPGPPPHEMPTMVAGLREAAPPPAAPPSEPPLDEPAMDTRPDLIALPAWGIMTAVDEAGRDTVQFAATVWNAGPAPLSADGFRIPGQDLMDAYQNFFRDDVRVGHRRVGTFEYDIRPGHEHWHFTDFARYSLLDAEGHEVLRSGKEAFCLAATDAEDLTVPGADWRPDAIGFSECGTRGSLSLREVLPVGWGDTYVQSLPGQSFDITDLPNGTYLVEVVANPVGRLVETTRDNNRALREITIGGAPGARTVVATPYLGIAG